MTLHIFNPEHDIALASNLANFTAPHAARELRSGLGFLPALWAEDGDWVLVEDTDYAAKAYEKLAVRMGKVEEWRQKHVFFVGRHGVCPLRFERVEPWGWDAALRNYLLRSGIDKTIMPSLDALDDIRQLSHRAAAHGLLASLNEIEGTVGEATQVATEAELNAMIAQGRPVVVKAPWSSSGRGVRFVDAHMSRHVAGWAKNMLKAQGTLTVEPYYKKVKDFGMEFYSDGGGNVTYLGLSLFHTVNGAYAGNVIATESAKRDMMSRYVSDDTLQAIRQMVESQLGKAYDGRYKGPFGIDMMVVARDDRQGFLVHPCVEINLRRTMGHVALCLSPDDDELKGVMRITAGQNYLLNILSI